MKYVCIGPSIHGSCSSLPAFPRLCERLPYRYPAPCATLCGFGNGLRPLWIRTVPQSWTTLRALAQQALPLLTHSYNTALPPHQRLVPIRDILQLSLRRVCLRHATTHTPLLPLPRYFQQMNDL